VTQQIDDLARALASKVSRRQAVKAAAVSGFAALVATVRPGTARAGLIQTPCADFCTTIYGGATAATLECILASLQCTGPCYQFGPSSAPCRGVTCGSGSVCMAQNTENSSSLSGGAAMGVCIPVQNNQLL
jgi:hypothetical protein